MVMRGFLQLFALMIVRLDQSNDRPACAIGGVAVHKPHVLTSAQAVARFRRWFR